jgi:outer membrane murein-binding lipoprotein Lpp
MRIQSLIVACAVAGSGLLSTAVLASEADLQAMERRLQALEARVEKLEADLVATDAAVDAVQPLEPVPGGWRKKANWRVLDKGMQPHEVREVLGEPEDTRRVSKFEYWSYGNGLIRFYFNRVKSWELPDGLDPE